jgi:hypothetical protein
MGPFVPPESNIFVIHVPLFVARGVNAPNDRVAAAADVSITEPFFFDQIGTLPLLSPGHVACYDGE